MTPLSDTLAGLPYHLIAIIGRNTGLGLDANLKKTALVDKVVAWLLAAETVPRLQAALDPSLRQILTDLQLAEAPIPIRLLTRRYGPLRSPRSLIRAYRRQDPLSPLERLCLSGLVLPDPLRNELIIPPDIAARLPAPNQPSPRALPPPSDLAPVSLLCHDLAALLALLQRDAPRPLHRRWLPPRFLITWGHHCAQPPHTPTPRSELQTNRRRFLHYLAESAGFVTSPLSLVTGPSSRSPNDELPITNYQLLISPLPAAFLWLAAPPAARLQTLWATWGQPDLARWQRYRLPGYDWLTGPDRFLASLLRFQPPPTPRS